MTFLKIILFIYSVCIVLFLLISGLLTARTSEQQLLLLIFLPVLLHFVSELILLIKRKPVEEKAEASSRKRRITFALFLFLLFSFLLVVSTTNVLYKAPSQETPSPSNVLLPTVSPAAQVIRTIGPDPSSQINIRETATKSGKILTKVPPGTSFPFLGKVYDWYEIQLTASQTGFIHAEFVTEEKEDL